MSVEPTCGYCHRADKFRCRSALEAAHCNPHPVEEKGKAPEVTKQKPAIALTMEADVKSATVAKVEVASHVDGDPDLIRIQQGMNVILLNRSVVDTLIDSLNMIEVHLS